ncbi:MAG: serine/threonine-protein phosphatase [Acidimicrobiales bacterium]|nr:serine/threonine-protein phosphatase [Acidimicrobiales bacterium]
MRSRTARRSLPPLVVLVVGLLITALLAWLCWTVNDRNETRLLHIQVQEAGSVLTAAIPSVVTPPASAVDIAQATGGDPAKVSAYLSPYVGSGSVYASATLLALDPVPHVVGTMGVPPYVGPSSPRFLAALSQAERTEGPSVIGILGGSTGRRIGYVFAGPGSAYAVYVETALAPDERLPAASNAAFSDLDFAIYLGRQPVAGQLLFANVADLPLTGRTASAVAPVGDTALLLVAKPAGVLGGTLLADLTWIVALAGVALTLVATWIAASLARGRRLAEQLAVANRALYGQQRGIAQTLQRALLPKELPPIRGLETSLRYRPGVEGIDVGGDWCDVVELQPDMVLFVVGDVFGRGLEAATTMAALHYAIRAYAREGDAPATVLAKLSAFVQVEQGRRFASVLCGLLDVRGHRLVLANAGHLPPLLVSDGNRSYVEAAPGPPIGVNSERPYREVTVDVPPGSTLLAFTDGLVERRGEALDEGLARLKDAVPTPLSSLDECLDAMLAALVLPGARDDTALLGLRWTG